MKFSFIARTGRSGRWHGDALSVSRSGLHAWLTRSPSARSRSDEALGTQVKASFLASDRTYGARRVWQDLLANGSQCGLHRIERLMRLQALRARPRRRRLPKDEGSRQLDIVRPICWTASSTPSGRTRSGSPTSPTSGRSRVGSMWQP